jgi:uncharacterized repeat protein (TIGR01451 family)
MGVRVTCSRYARRICFVAVPIVLLSALAGVAGQPRADADPAIMPAVDLTISTYSGQTSDDGIWVEPAGSPNLNAAALSHESSLPIAYAPDDDLAYESEGTIVVEPANGGPLKTVISGIGQTYQIQYDAAGNLFALGNLAGGNNGEVIEAPADGSAQRVVVSGLDGGSYGLAVDSSDNLYVSSTGTDASNHYVGTITKITPGGAQTVLTNQLLNPRGLTFDSAGNLYVADFLAGAVYKVGADATLTYVASFNHPTSIAFDQYNNMYVAVETNGPDGYIAELPADGSGTVDISQALDVPYTVITKPVITVRTPTLSASSDIYIADPDGVLMIPHGSNAYALIEPQPADLSQSADLGADALVVDGDGNFYASHEPGELLEKYSSSGTDLGPYFNDSNERIGQAAIDNEGNIYAEVVVNATDVQELLKIAAGGGSETTLATLPDDGDSTAVAVDSHDNAYQYDGDTNTVEEYPATGTAPQLYASNVAPGGARVAALAIDSQGNLWVASYSGSGLIEYPAAGGAAKIFSNSYVTSYGTFDPTTEPLIAFQLVVDSSDNVYVSASPLTPDNSFVEGDGIWELPVGGTQFVQLTQANPVYALGSNGQDVYTMAVPHGPTTTGPGAPTLSGTPTAAAAGAAYSFQFGVGGSPVPTLTTSGVLPHGIKLDKHSGLLSGTATQIGTYTFTVTAANGIGNPATDIVTVVVGPGRATNVKVDGGDGQNALEGATFKKPLTVLVTDAYGNPVPNATVDFEETSDPAAAEFNGNEPSATVVSGPDGTASSPPLIANQLSSAVDIQALGTNIAGPAVFTLSVTSGKTPKADLGITLTGLTKAAPGATVTATVTVTNHSTTTASAVVTALSLPSGITVTSTSGGTTAEDIVTWTSPTLAPGASVSYVVTGSVNPGLSGYQNLNAGVSSSTDDPATGNNHATAKLHF